MHRKKYKIFQSLKKEKEIEMKLLSLLAKGEADVLNHRVHDGKEVMNALLSKASQKRHKQKK